MFGKLGMVPDGDHNDIYENMCQRLHLCTSLQVHARNGLQHAPGGWLATRSGTAAEPMGPGLCRMLDLDFREPLLGTWVNKVQASGVSEKLAMSVHRTSWDAFLAVTTGKGTRTVDNIYYGSCALTFEAAP